MAHCYDHRTMKYIASGAIDRQQGDMLTPVRSLQRDGRYFCNPADIIDVRDGADTDTSRFVI